MLSLTNNNPFTACVSASDSDIIYGIDYNYHINLSQGVGMGMVISEQLWAYSQSSADFVSGQHPLVHVLAYSEMSLTLVFSGDVSSKSLSITYERPSIPDYDLSHGIEAFRFRVEPDVSTMAQNTSVRFLWVYDPLHSPNYRVTMTYEHIDSFNQSTQTYVHHTIQRILTPLPGSNYTVADFWNAMGGENGIEVSYTGAKFFATFANDDLKRSALLDDPSIPRRNHHYEYLFWFDTNSSQSVPLTASFNSLLGTAVVSSTPEPLSTFNPSDPFVPIYYAQFTQSTTTVGPIDVRRMTLQSLENTIRTSIAGNIMGFLTDCESATATGGTVDTSADSLRNNVYVAAITSNTYIANSSADLEFSSQNIFLSGSANYDFSTISSISLLCSSIEHTSAFAGMFIECRPGLYYGQYSSDLLPHISVRFDSWNPPDYNRQFTIKTASGTVVGGNYAKTLTGITIHDLATDINQKTNSLYNASPVNNHNSDDATTIVDDGPFTLTTNPSSHLFHLIIQVPIVETYSLSAYPLLSDLVSAINSRPIAGNSSDTWTARGLTASVDSATADHMDESITQNLNALATSNVYNTSLSLTGHVHNVIDPNIPTYNIQVNFDVTVSGGGGGNGGLQAALGGYSKGGTDFLNQAPNNFQEPGFNVFFPIEYTVENSDKMYILLRTRVDADGTVFTSRAEDYSASATYQNGSPTQSLPPVIETTDPFLSAWLETNIGNPPADQVPIALIVPLSGPRIDVHISDTNIGESLSVTIKNTPIGLTEYAFLAINRTNRNGSMTESRQGKVFGLVLDNRGAWDILIGPECVLKQISQAGNFSYLGEQYSRTLLVNDEAYTLDFADAATLPNAVRNGISFSPVPGYPQVWVMRIDNAVKDYLMNQRVGASINSQEGCSVDIDFTAMGRITGATGIGRVTLFADVYCVFDINLCDTFWNLKEPTHEGLSPNPGPGSTPTPVIIENRLLFTHESLLNCNQIDLPSTDGTIIVDVPILTHIQNVPMFPNGVAVLLLKSSYTAEIQAFYPVTTSDWQSIDFENCTPITGNASLVYSLNKPALYLPGQPVPVVDTQQIQSLLATEASYMYVQPSFHFPTNDVTVDCGNSETVVMAIGYTFKNWSSGYRHEDVAFGVEMHIGSDTFVLPQLVFCYRYYYNQNEG